jgi:hypothetical protein
MSRMNRRSIGALGAIVAILTSASGASAKDPAFSFALDPSVRSAPIRITNAFSFGSGVVHHECVSWINRSTKTVVAIRFVFTYVDASGVIRGTDPFDRRGSFPAGVANEGLSSMSQVDSPLRYRHLWDNCRGYTFPREGIAVNRLSIERVDFDDGTSWTVPATSPSPAAISSPAASPVP